jgi:hypothetical protein
MKSWIPSARRKMGLMYASKPLTILALFQRRGVLCHNGWRSRAGVDPWFFGNKLQRFRLAGHFIKKFPAAQLSHQTKGE